MSVFNAVLYCFLPLKMKKARRVSEVGEPFSKAYHFYWLASDAMGRGRNESGSAPFTLEGKIKLE